MAASKREELGQIVIRPPAGMRERIKAAAEANNRSMNAEIVATLDAAYPEPKHPLGLFGEIYELMNFVESAESNEQKQEFLRSANEQIRNSEFSGWIELALTEHPERPGELVVFMRGLNNGKGPGKGPGAGIKRFKP